MSDTDTDFNENPVSFSGDQKLKLSQLIQDGMKVLRDVEVLNEGLSESIKALAEELNIKSTVLKRAIKIAHKAEFGKAQREQELLETILTTVGRTL